MGPDYLSDMRRTIEESWVAEGLEPEQMPLGIQRFMCVVDNRQEALEYVDNARHQMRLASNLRRREEVVDGAMLIEQPAPNEPTIDEAVDNLLVGDCETIAERLDTVIRRLQQLQEMTGITSLVLHYPPYYGIDNTLKSLRLFAEEVMPAFRIETTA
jgi:alkanesulfonate monooxygenase SsuD/methylene tetrahydromethanopterin reductase-like flavin-dependent oxidoreductase (luciferase family)